MGYLLSSFLWMYLICLLPVGLLVDRFGGKVVNAVGIGVWSAATVLTGFTTGFVRWQPRASSWEWASPPVGPPATASSASGFQHRNAALRTPSSAPALPPVPPSAPYWCPP